MMKKIKILGDNDDYELIVRHGGGGYPYSQNEIERIYTYLDESPCAIAWLGFKRCAFGCKDFVCESYETDGVWAWQGGLLHYITDHFIELPDEFLKHILSGERPSCPESLISTFEANAFKKGEEKVVDRYFWAEWMSRFLDKDQVEPVYFVKSPYRKPSHRKAPPGSFSGWSDFEL
ncbi:hypothetical protein [uncultured Microbulbifer sp.]|uniref:hypothetical protein n=1 Tax=uncultured Microbulbifer sp. TaxID=348147 RepID=UPI0026256EB3|nr:hypothetical protein [uncultured Microbulbifer sp.]